MNDNFKINVGNPIDSRYLDSTNQPYVSENAVKTAIVQSQRYVGLTVNINNIEYWFEEGVLDANLVVKDSGLASTGVTAAYNGITKEANAVKLGGTLTGATTFTKSGTGSLLKYAGDYSSEYDAQTIPDAAYVTGLTSQSVITSSNGLTKTDQDVELGGTTPLSKATNICGGTQALNLGTVASKLGVFTVNAASASIISDTTTDICPTGILTLDGSAISVKEVVSYDADKSSSYTLRSLPDVNFVTGLTSNAILTASNGLTKTGTDVTLGGTLATDTIINLNNGNCFQLCDTGNNADYIFDKDNITLTNNGSILDISNVGDDFTLTHCSGSNVDLSLSGLTYGGDYEANFKPNTLVTKAYVDAASGGILANNGLTRAGDIISLGGNLTGDTTISSASHDNCLLITSPFCASDVHVLDFDATPTVGWAEGQLYYSNCHLHFDREISGVTTQLGEENIIRVENQTGVLIPNGTIVYVYGAAVSGYPLIGLADATDFVKATQTVGIATQDILNNNEGYITSIGIVHNVDTNGFAAGTLLWLNTSGTYSDVRPSYPNYSVNVGIVTKEGIGDGEIYTRLLYVPNYTEYGLFTGYTASTSTALDLKLDISTYTTYTAATKIEIDNNTNVTAVALTGASNGLCASNGRDVTLGGALTKATTISGNQVFTIGTSQNVCLATTNTKDIGINAKSNGGIYLKSQSGTVEGSDPANAVMIQLDYNSTAAMLVTDNRPTPRGLQYGDDYSDTFIDRSLVDKYYVDSIATGLNAHAAVSIATRLLDGNIDLTGVTQTIDGIVVSAITATNNRILVKNQTNKAFNGIYSASTGIWGRTDDYNFDPSGEVANGDLIPVISGITNHNSQWILTTQNPIVSGDTLTFSLFSQQQGIIDGDGIFIDTVGANRQVAVKLSDSNSGLCFDSNALELDYTVFRYGLTSDVTTGKIDVCAEYGDSVGTQIPVRVDTGGTNALYVDQDCFSYTTAINGLSKEGCNVVLGGDLTGNTEITGAAGTADLIFSSLNNFNLGYDNSATITDSSVSPAGLQYAGDYKSSFIDNSLVTKLFVNDAITGDTLTFCGGLTKTADVITWGGVINTDRALLYGGVNFCVKSTGIDFLTNCSCVLTTNNNINLRSCNNICDSSIGLNDTGAMSIVANNATQGLTITSAAHGAVYAGDYEVDFVARSLATAAYVTGKTSTSGIQTASNGLTKTGTEVKLGGTLSEATNFTGGLNGLTYSGINGGISSIACFQPTYNQFQTICDSIGLNNSLQVSNVGVHIGASDSGGNSCFELTPNFLRIVANNDNVLQVIDNTTNQEGLKYFGCYSTGFTSSCSIVDKGYVDGEITGAANTFENGLTKTGTNVTLGGILSETTTISGGSQVINFGTTSSQIGFNICGSLNSVGSQVLLTGDRGTLCMDTCETTITSCFDVAQHSTICLDQQGIEVSFGTGTTGSMCYFDDYSADFTLRSLVDVAYVTGLTTTSGVQTASNGLTKTGTDVALGGDLTGNTTINVGGNNLILSGTTNMELNLNSTELSFGDYNSTGNNYLVIDNSSNFTYNYHSENSGACRSNLVVQGYGATCINSATDTKYACIKLNPNQVNGGVYINAAACFVLDTYIDIKTGSTTIGGDVSYFAGAQYGDDYSSNYTLRSIPDVAYVTGLTSTSGIQTANNGLTKEGQNVRLGGTLTGDTTISGAHTLALSSLTAFNATATNIGLSGIVTATGAIHATSTLGVSGATTLGSTLNVIGAIDGNNSLDILGTTALRSTLDVTGATTIGGTLTLSSVAAGDVGTDEVMLIDSSGVVKKVAASTLGEDNNIYDMTVVTTDVTLTTGSTYVQLVNVASSGITVTLPANPIDGQVFRIKDAAGSALAYNITIARNGKLIDGGTIDGILNTDNGALEIVYNNALGSWFVFSFVN